MKKIIDEIWGGGTPSTPTPADTSYAPTSAGQTPSAAKIGKGIVAAIKQTNTLFIRSNRIDMDHIEQLIKATDQPTPQVMIEARIIEASSNFARDFGLQWGGSYSYANPYGPAAGTVRGFSSDTGNTAVNLPIGTGSPIPPLRGWQESAWPLRRPTSISMFGCGPSNN